MIIDIKMKRPVTKKVDLKTSFSTPLLVEEIFPLPNDLPIPFPRVWISIKIVKSADKIIWETVKTSLSILMVSIPDFG